MNHSRLIIISALKRGAVALSIFGMLAIAGQLSAHGGFDHVVGTVVKVEQNVLTVKTAKGNVDVRLNEKTEITRSGQKSGIADLKPGTRIVVDVPEGAKEKIAHSVKVGVSESNSHKAPTSSK